MKKLCLILVAAAAALFSSALLADNYPSKPVTLVAVFGPGSASDTICRVIAQPLSVALKESVIVENRPGANGALAALYVARSAPDGHTLLMATNSPLSTAPFLMKNVSYDPVKDFAPVTRLQRSPLFPELPTLDEAGVTDFDMDSWAGIVAPAHTPPAIVTQLNRELRKIIDDPDVKSKLGNVGFEAFSSTSKEFEDFVKVQLGKWSKMVKDAGIQPE